ncbi:MAG TPA: diguanylate cyclase [Dokdonella sp.]|nr:diguanylate cyclase [Dokdonella sp.]
MFNEGTHRDLVASLEMIGAAFAIFEVDKDAGQLHLVSANTLFADITSMGVNAFVGETLSQMLPRCFEEPMRACFLKCLVEQASQEDEIVIEREGKSRWWRVIASPIVGESSSGQCVIVTLIDITRRKVLEQQLHAARQRFEAVVETAYDGIITMDEKQSIKLMNQAARNLFRVEDEDVNGSNLERFLPERFREKHQAYVTAFRDSPVNARPMQSRVSVRGLRADGSEFPVEVTISKIRVGAETEMTAVIRDISERARLIEELSHAAERDSLTGLYNRRHGSKVLGKELIRSKHLGHTFCIAIVDIDFFKLVNDTYGHAVGDEALVDMGKVLRGSLRDIDLLCRWGGEEFLVMLPETGAQEAGEWAARARQLVAAHTFGRSRKREIRMTLSVGIAVMGEGLSIDQLIDLADRALYSSKSAGRDRVSFAE